MGCASSRPQVDAATSSVVVQPVPDKPGLDDAHKPVQQRKRDIFDVEVVQKDQQRAVAKQETPVMHQARSCCSNPPEQTLCGCKQFVRCVSHISATTDYCRR